MISIRLLCCNGGIGGSSRHSTCYLLDRSLLIDAGTGLGMLPLEEMIHVDNVLLTHAHLDHIACLPLLVDSVAGQRRSPVQVWALEEVLNTLREHVFNEKIWPDFTRIPSPDAPFMRLNRLPENLVLDGMRISPLPAMHGIPACGLRVERSGAAVAFSGDTADCERFWENLSSDPVLKAVIVECSYPSRLKDLAQLSMHMETSSLHRRLSELPTGVTSVIVHRKPGLEDEIAAELRAGLTGHDLRLPAPGDALVFSA